MSDGAFCHYCQRSPCSCPPEPERPDRFVVLYVWRSMSHASRSFATREEAERLADELRCNLAMRDVAVWSIAELNEVAR